MAPAACPATPGVAVGSAGTLGLPPQWWRFPPLLPGPRGPHPHLRWCKEGQTPPVGPCHPQDYGDGWWTAAEVKLNILYELGDPWLPPSWLRQFQPDCSQHWAATGLQRGGVGSRRKGPEMGKAPPQTFNSRSLDDRRAANFNFSLSSLGTEI